MEQVETRQAALYAAGDQPPHVPIFDRDEAYQERMARRRKIADKVRELQAPEIARLEQRRQTEKNRRNAIQASRKKNRRNKR